MEPSPQQIRDAAHKQALDIIVALLIARDAARSPSPTKAVRAASNVARFMSNPELFQDFAEQFGEDALELFQQGVIRRVDHIVSMAEKLLQALIADEETRDSEESPHE